MKFIDKFKEVFGGKKDTGFTEDTVDVIQSFQDADDKPNILQDLPENKEEYSDDILQQFADDAKTFSMGSNSQTNYDLTEYDGSFKEKVIATINLKRIPASELVQEREQELVEAKDYLAELKVLLTKHNLSILQLSNTKIKIANERNMPIFDLNRTGSIHFYSNINAPWVIEIARFVILIAICHSLIPQPYRT